MFKHKLFYAKTPTHVVSVLCMKNDEVVLDENEKEMIHVLLFLKYTSCRTFE